MRLVICHSCWNWVTPSGNTCPECHQVLDITRPDPTPAELAAIFGESIARLATVRLERRKLPSWGSLVGTTTGLLFVPFLQARADGGLAAPNGGPRGWQNWTLWNFWRKPAFPAGRVLAELGHASLQASAGPDVVELFLDSPGSLFIPREQLLRLHVRGQRWSVARSRGSITQMQVLSPPDEWRPAWRQLTAATPAWQSIVPR